jgi:hypothetical protein
MMTELSFEDAVNLFKQLGYIVKLGPNPGEVTLIFSDHTGKTFCVYETTMLISIALEIINLQSQRAAVRH